MISPFPSLPLSSSGPAPPKYISVSTHFPSPSWLLISAIIHLGPWPSSPASLPPALSSQSGHVEPAAKNAQHHVTALLKTHQFLPMTLRSPCVTWTGHHIMLPLSLPLSGVGCFAQADFWCLTYLPPSPACYKLPKGTDPAVFFTKYPWQPTQSDNQPAELVFTATLQMHLLLHCPMNSKPDRSRQCSKFH